MGWSLDDGRAAFGKGAWDAAFDSLAAADAEQPLEPEDLALLGSAAYLTGREPESIPYWARAFNAAARTGQVDLAARTGFIMSLTLVLRGDAAQATGWLARAQRIAAADSPARGLLLTIESVFANVGGEIPRARELAEEALRIGDRSGDPEVCAMARLTTAETLAETGDVGGALKLVDEAMIAVTGGEVSPVFQGFIYCACIVLCQKAFDVRRAQEWTRALDTWCQTKPGMVPFRGQCLVHRAELLTLTGAWGDAMVEARTACEHLARAGRGPYANALYQCGELHRLLGRFDEAEQAYREASARGMEPQPGLSLLRLAQGNVDAAAAAIRRIVAEIDSEGFGPGGLDVGHTSLLEPYVEIMLAAGDLAAARAGAEELEEATARFGVPLVRARASRAMGSVLLAEADAPGALDKLRAAWSVWKEVDAPYEVARTRVLLAQACRALDDTDTASMHFDAARATFEALGAAPELERLRRVEQPAAVPGPLSARELEVLKFIADGATNREIANTLVISERTVARHLSNIFTKLGVSSRTAAGAYAFKHGLV
jgi:DNA-binding CsgD family transcriptional regulator/tetratricopeptide (TPR) repeat protein